jgi:elongation factor Ts
MSAVTASMVKDLRERTGAGMMECKKALVETGGDLDTAIEVLRKRGAATAEKKAGRLAAEGAIVLYSSGDGREEVLVEVNSETDFVAKDSSFLEFAGAVAECVAREAPPDVESLMSLPLVAGGESVEQARQRLVSRVGENISVRRFIRLCAGDDHRLSSYVHGRRIGVVIETSGGRADLGRDLAMHVAAARPICVGEADLPADLLDRERGIYAAQARETGKPDDIVDKIAAGKLAKFVRETTLLGQGFVKDPDRSVADLLEQERAAAHRFVRFEVGEGLEKRSDDFVKDVMAQAQSI